MKQLTQKDFKESEHLFYNCDYCYRKYQIAPALYETNNNKIHLCSVCYNELKKG